MEPTVLPLIKSAGDFYVWPYDASNDLLSVLASLCHTPDALLPKVSDCRYLTEIHILESLLCHFI
jgi:hypothetical protein